MAPMIGSKDRIGDPTRITVPLRGGDDLSGLDGRVTALERRQCCPASTTPDPALVRVSNTAVGQGEYVVTALNTMTNRYMHTPGEFDDYAFVFLAYTIPSVVPGGSTWTIKVTYGGKTMTYRNEFLTGGSATDATRGAVQYYDLPITPGQGPQEVVVTCTTGLNLTGRAGNPTYTFASNSVTVSNWVGSASSGWAGGTGSNDRTTFGALGADRRYIGVSSVATTPARTYVQSGSGGPAKVLWEAFDKDGRRIVIFEDRKPQPEPLTIMHGGGAKFAAGALVVNVNAPSKVL
jgi:hypothetical protein